LEGLDGVADYKPGNSKPGSGLKVNANRARYGYTRTGVFVGCWIVLAGCAGFTVPGNPLRVGVSMRTQGVGVSQPFLFIPLSYESACSRFDHCVENFSPVCWIA
jgi:hypothetical protein